MSSRATTKAQARERVEAMRAGQARKERRRRLLLAGTAVLVVLVVVAGLVVAKLAGVGSGSGSTPKAAGGGAGARSEKGMASAAVLRDVTTVPRSVLDAIGPGTAAATPRKITAPAITVDGKPQVLYVGADYCPFCAAQRWALTVALSRFGTFSKLGATHSATNDVYPDTQTLSFHGAAYTSQYVSFTGVETVGNTPGADGRYPPLDTLSAADQKTESTYNTAQYVGSPGIPFLDIGGRYVAAGTFVDPKLLVGLSREQIAASLAKPNNPVARAVDGAANVITAAICDVTRGVPVKVCTARGVGASFGVFGKSAQ